MTQQKIGQSVMIGIEGTRPSKTTLAMIEKNNIGGVILFARNIENPTQCASLIKSLQEAAKEAPLFIGIDEEGGRVSRLPRSFTSFPAARIVGACNDIPLTYDYAAAVAEELSSVGINMNFAPVLDIDTNPKNPVIGDRAFGKTPLVVEEHALAMISGLQDNHVISCGKHFPGHGDTDLDSHHALPLVNLSLSQMADRELRPFVHVIQNRLSAIMTAHVLYPHLDPDRPATLSKKILTSLLRQTLHFSGVVISDDLEMKGITHQWKIAEAAPMAMEAGCDLLLICGTGDARMEALEAVIHAVERGEISEERMDQSLRRILALKEQFLLPRKGPTDPREIKKTVGCAKHHDLVKKIKKQASRAPSHS